MLNRKILLHDIIFSQTMVIFAVILDKFKTLPLLHTSFYGTKNILASNYSLENFAFNQFINIINYWHSFEKNVCKVCLFNN